MNIKRTKGHGRYATYALEKTEPSQGWHVKLRPSAEAAQLTDEAARTKWASDRLPSPRKAWTCRLPGVAALITETVQGSPSYKYIDVLEPELIVAGVSSAINAIQSVAIEGFPYEPPRWTTEQGIAENVTRLSRSKTKHRELHPDFANRTLRELKDIIDGGPGDQSKALSHGDLCMPNVLLDDEGVMTGIVDLGGLHVGDNRLDLGTMSWTVQASMGDKWAVRLLDMHDTSANDQGIVYNRLVYDLGLERPDPWAWTQTQQLNDQRARLSA